MDTIKRVIELLDERGYTPFTFFKENSVGVTYSTVHATEKRGGQLSVDTIEKICKAIGITLGEFFWIPGVTAPERSECEPLSDEEITTLRVMISEYLAGKEKEKETVGE